MTNTTRLPSCLCLCTNSRTCAISSSSDVGGGCVAKYLSAEKVDSVSGRVVVFDMIVRPSKPLCSLSDQFALSRLSKSMESAHSDKMMRLLILILSGSAALQ